MDQIISEFENRTLNQEKIPSVLLKPKKKAIERFLTTQLEKVDLKKLNYLQKKVLVNKLVDDWFKTRVPSGKSVGVISAQSLGEKATQQSMKTVHTAGVNLGKSSLQGISRIEEILDVKQNPAKPSMKFFIRNENISSIEAKVIANSFEFVTFGDLVVRKEKKKYDKKKAPEWYKVFDLIYKNPKADEDEEYECLIFKMDVSKCFMKRIRYKQIADILKNEETIEGGSSLRIYFSDLATGEFHILIPDIALNPYRENKYENKIQYFTNLLLETPIVGITGITGVYASCYNLNTMIKEWKQKDSIMVPIYNSKELKRTLISERDVLKFVESRTGIKQKNGGFDLGKLSKEDFMAELMREDVTLEKVCKIKEEKLNYIVTYPEEIDKIDFLSGLPGDASENDDKTVKISKKSTDMEDIKKTKLPIRKRINMNKLWYWETDGSNLAEIYDFNGYFVRDDDSTEKIKVVYEKLTSNHIVDVANILGISAARRLIVEEMMLASSDVQIGHVNLLASAMCSEGFMIQVTRHGIPKLDVDWLSRISFEENTKQMFISSGLGMVSKLQSIDSNIISGGLIPVGAELEGESKKEIQKAKIVLKKITSMKPKPKIISKKPSTFVVPKPKPETKKRIPKEEEETEEEGVVSI